MKESGQDCRSQRVTPLTRTGMAAAARSNVKHGLALLHSSEEHETGEKLDHGAYPPVYLKHILTASRV